MRGGLATLVVVYAGILAAANPLPTLPELVPPIIGGLLLTGLVTFGADFLKRERQSADILRQEAVAVLNSTRDALVVTDPNNRVVSANRAALELAGAASIDEFRSTPLIDLFKRTFEDDGTLTRIAEHYATPDRLHEPFHATLQCRPPLVGFWEIEGRLMTGDQPETRLLWILRDVTSERIRQQERADLVQMAVHELRSPMTSVSVVAGLASTGELDLTDAERRSYFLGVIETNSRRLMTLVEDLLTLSRIEAPDFQIVPTTQDLRDIAADAVARLRPQIEAAGHRLETVYQSDPVTVSADAAWLGIVVDNLLSNAIKYTPAGGGLLVVVEQKDGHGQLDVSDTGIGMSEAEQARLFDRFFRARNATSSEIPGSGLGLPIARQIVRLHGGDIHVVSAPGAGSTFTVLLPLA
jgi:signal transduction histidine kinase